MKAVVGSNSDHDLLRQLAGDADIVFACVSVHQRKEDIGTGQQY